MSFSRCSQPSPYCCRACKAFSINISWIMRNLLSRESAAFHHLLLHIILQSQGKWNTTHLIVHKWFSLCKPNSRFNYHTFPVTPECLHSLCLQKEIFQSKNTFQSSCTWSKSPWDSFSLWGEWFLVCYAVFGRISNVSWLNFKLLQLLSAHWSWPLLFSWIHHSSSFSTLLSQVALLCSVGHS